MVAGRRDRAGEATGELLETFDELTTMLKSTHELSANVNTNDKTHMIRNKTSITVKEPALLTRKTQLTLH